MAGLYIHIPFCASRCIYCDFFTSTHTELREAYVEALCGEMKLKTKGERPSVSTVYLGGGTPSQLTRPQLDKLFQTIFDCFSVAPDAEITMECNPDDVTPYYIAGTPVNRVSMGAQSFDDARLRFIHRRHNALQVETAVRRLRKEGIANISIDLIFGFPGERLSDWEADVDRALALGVEHVSAYALMYEEGTPLYRLWQQGKVKEVEEEVSLAMFETLILRMERAGFEHYEISNFSLPGFRSRHNSSYWKGIPYYGIGAAAHGYDTLSRSWNVADTRAYIASISQGVIPAEREELTPVMRFNDLVATALRTKEGIALNDLSEADRHYLLLQAGKHIDAGLLELNNHCLRLTRKGIFVSDGIMVDLIQEQ